MRIVKDLLDANNHIKLKETLEEDFNIKINFIDYATLTRSIPRDQIDPLLTPIAGPWCQEFMLEILSHTKSNKAINKVFKKSNKTIPMGDGGNQWSDYFKIPHTANRDVNIKMLQYKILHRILATNKKLKQYGIKDSDNCDFCGIETESILHIFCECDLTTHIWQSIADWLTKSGIRIGYFSDW